AGQDRVGGGDGRFQVVQPLDGAERHAAHVLDEAEPQHGGDGPQLADRERGHLLERPHEPARIGEVDPAFGVRNERDDQLVHPRISGQRSAGELGQLAVIPAREALPHLADVLLHHMVVVEEPLAGGADLGILVHGAQQALACLGQDDAGTVEPAEQRRLPPRATGQALAARQGVGPLRQALGAEEFALDRPGEDALVRVGAAADQAGNEPVRRDRSDDWASVDGVGERLQRSRATSSATAEMSSAAAVMKISCCSRGLTGAGAAFPSYSDWSITLCAAATSSMPATKCRWWMTFSASGPGSKVASCAALSTAFLMSPPLR